MAIGIEYDELKVFDFMGTDINRSLFHACGKGLCENGV